MAELKTKQTDQNVEGFLNTITDEKKRGDCFELLKIMQDITGEPPRMWGPSIIGFGSYHYLYESGREGDWFLTGFSPRKQNLTIYIMAGFDRYDELLAKIGKYKTGKSCLYIKRLDDIDKNVLGDLIRFSVEYLKR